MSYCGHCGEKLEEGAKFCKKCGTRAGSSGSEIRPVAGASGQGAPVLRGPGRQANLVDQCYDLRAQNLQELGRMFRHFGEKEALYDEYDFLNSRYEALSRMRGSAAGTVGVVLSAIGGVALFIVVFLVVIAVKSPGRRALVPRDYLDFTILHLIPLALVAAGMLCLREDRNIGKKRKEEMGRCGARIAEIANELTRHYYAYGPCLVGIEYSNPKIIAAIGQMVKSGRANTPAEAINRMLEDAHMSFMQIQAEITARSARQAAASASVAAGASVVGAIGSFCSPHFVIHL